MSQAMEPFIQRRTFRGREYVLYAEFVGVVDRMAQDISDLRDHAEVHWKTREHLVAEVDALRVALGITREEVARLRKIVEAARPFRDLNAGGWQEAVKALREAFDPPHLTVVPEEDES